MEGLCDLVNVSVKTASDLNGRENAIIVARVNKKTMLKRFDSILTLKCMKNKIEKNIGTAVQLYDAEEVHRLDFYS